MMSDPDRPETVCALTQDVIRVLAPNPSPMTHWGTNSYIIGAGAQRVLIDPGPDMSAHHDAIMNALPAGVSLSHILVTHAHRDHSAGAAALNAATGAPVYAFGDAHSGRTDIMRALAQSGTIGGGEGVDQTFCPDIDLAHDQILETPAGPVTALHTPGHMGNHLCFAWNGYVFTGDLIMGWSSSLISPPDGDAAAFRISCQNLLDRPDATFFSGHGDPIENGHARITHLLAHRQSREAAIIDALRGGPLTLHDLTLAVYVDIDPRALPAAARNAFAHLIDMEQQNVVSAHPRLSADATFILL